MSRINNDVINRQAAIDALTGNFNITGKENAEIICNYISNVDKKLRELPSAEQHGRWIELYKDNYKCSACGAWYKSDGPIDFSYCPVCGAKMDLGE